MRTWINNKLLPTMNKVGNQRHLATIRDAFAIITPVIIVGAFAVLWRSVLFSPWGGKGTLTGAWFWFNNFKIDEKSFYFQILNIMSQYMVYIQVATINCLTVYLVVAFGYYLSKNKNLDSPYIGSILALVAFLISINLMTSVNWEGSMYWLGARGMLGGIIVTIIAIELFALLSTNNNLVIKMPEGVPPAVGRSFAKLLPIIITILTIAFINLVLWLPTYDFGRKEGPLWNPKEGSSLEVLLKNSFKFTESNWKQVFNIFGINASHFEKPGFDAIKKLLENNEIKDAIDKLNQLGFKGANAFDPNGDDWGRLISQLDLSVYETSIGDKPISGGMTFVSFLYVIVVAPFLGLAKNSSFLLGLAILYVLLIGIFWFIGLHGANIANGIFNPIWLLLYSKNIAGDNNIFVQGTFDAFIFIGGAGATLALVITTLLFGKKNTSQYQISKLSLGPGVFQINEPVMFGYPIVLNPMMFIPWIIVMPILCITTYIGYQLFPIAPVKVLSPWTAPFFIAAFLATSGSWVAPILALINLAIAILVYLPFVIIMNRQHQKQIEKSKIEKQILETKNKI